MNSFVRKYGDPTRTPVAPTQIATTTPPKDVTLGSTTADWEAKYGPLVDLGTSTNGDCFSCSDGPNISAANGQPTQLDGITSTDGLVTAFYINFPSGTTESAANEIINKFLPEDKRFIQPSTGTSGQSCGPGITADCFSSGGSCKIWNFSSHSLNQSGSTIPEFSVAMYSDDRKQGESGNGNPYDPNNVTSAGIFNFTSGGC